ncbi:MAG: response regulator [Thermoflexales bacterium]|nr:response regulator [Thermoflexales bacterium]
MSTPRIFIVAEDGEFLSTVRQALQAGGEMSIFTATDSQTALRLLPEIRPDLILIDARMLWVQEAGLPIKARRFSSAPILFLNPPGGARFPVQGQAGGNGFISRVRNALVSAGIRVTSLGVML